MVGTDECPRSMPKSLSGGELEAGPVGSAGLAGLSPPSRSRGVSTGGEGPQLEQGLLGSG